MSTLNGKPRLRTKVKEYEEMEVSLKAIRHVPDQLQSRVGLNKERAGTYAARIAEGAKFPPIDLFRVLGELYLVDGYHRYDAYKQLGYTSIRAVIRDGTMSDAILFSVEANKENNDFKLTKKDFKRAAELMIRDFVLRSWSDREISRRTGLHPGSIRLLRAALRESEGIEFPLKVVNFKPNGEPTGRLRAYKHETGRVRAAACKGRSYYYVRINGEQVRLGTDEEIAETKLQDLRTVRIMPDSAFERGECFSLWLAKYGHNATPNPHRSLKGRVVGGAYLLPIAKPNVDTVLASFAACIITLSENKDIAMCYLVGYFGDVSGSTRTVIDSVLRVESRVTFTTPEELIGRLSRNPVGQGGSE